MKQTTDSSKKQCRILAVDDESEVRHAYLQALTFDQRELETTIQDVFNTLGEDTQPEHSSGFDLSLADQGNQAIELMRQALEDGNPYTVAFIDMRMPPGIDGLETAKTLRALDDRIYIVFVTAYSDRTAAELDTVMEHEILLLRKPFVNEEIYQLARSLSRSWQKDRRLEQALLNAEQSNRAKDQFLAAMSHEFRTPLSTLLGYGELLSQGNLNQDQRQLLEQMEHAGKSLLFRINDVLDATKLQSGRLELHPTPFQLSKVIDELQSVYIPQLQEQDLKFSIHCDLASPDTRFGDRERLLQLLSNLLSNAIKFTPQGKISLTLTEPTADTLSFVIEDSGIGMSDTVLESAFRPFEQGDQRLSRSYGGIGMGLHISLQLAEVMGGTLSATSKEGEGSRFDLRLPLPCESATTSHAAIGSSPEHHMLCGKVLLVEDTPEIQLLIQRFLESSGLEVTLAENGKIGVETALSTQFDLILMDLQMPIMGGIEATDLLRQVGYTAPIIALTANMTDEHRKQFFAAGGDDFLTKPIDQESLREHLQKYLDESEEGQSPSDNGLLIDDSLATLFKERCAHLRTELLDASEQQAWQDVQVIAHTVKGSGTTFGFPELTHIGSAICNAVIEGQTEALPELITALEQEMANVG